jgi:CHAD domain-containing protein
MKRGAPLPLDVQRIENNVRKLRKVLKKAPKRINPDQIHKIRTGARRIEAVLETLARDASSNERRLLKYLAEIRKRCGKVRDMDVFSTHLAATNLKSETQALVLLFEYLGAKRYRYAQKLHQWMKRKGPVTRRRLKKMSARLEKSLKKADHLLTSDAGLTADAMASALALSSALAVPSHLQSSNLHEYRIKIKDLRDILQSVTHAEQHNKFVETLGKCKDAIGEWHDWEELLRIAGKVLKDEKNTKLLGELKKICEQKYQHALAVTNKMREEYVQHAKGGEKSQRRVKGKGATPGLQVVKAMTA